MARQRVHTEKGVYQLHMVLDEPRTIRIGKLGTFLFPAGRYVYTGSAMNGLKGRIERHRKRKKRLHWHIDYFLQYARITDVKVNMTTRRLECAWNKATERLPGANHVAPGFGSSDCQCTSHLVHVGTARR